MKKLGNSVALLSSILMTLGMAGSATASGPARVLDREGQSATARHRAMPWGRDAMVAVAEGTGRGWMWVSIHPGVALASIILADAGRVRYVESWHGDVSGDGRNVSWVVTGQAGSRRISSSQPLEPAPCDCGLLEEIVHEAEMDSCAGVPLLCGLGLGLGQAIVSQCQGVCQSIPATIAPNCTEMADLNPLSGTTAEAFTEVSCSAEMDDIYMVQSLFNETDISVRSTPQAHCFRASYCTIDHIWTVTPGACYQTYAGYTLDWGNFAGDEIQQTGSTDDSDTVCF